MYDHTIEAFWSALESMKCDQAILCLFEFRSFFFMYIASNIMLTGLSYIILANRFPAGENESYLNQQHIWLGWRGAAILRSQFKLGRFIFKKASAIVCRVFIIRRGFRDLLARSRAC